MRIVEENALKIYPTKQVIDQSLGLPSPFQDRNQVYVISGGQGTGKSTWLNSALTCRKKDGKIFAGCFQKVFYATPEECFFGSEKEHPMKNHVKSRLFHKFDVQMLNSVVEQALENKHENGGSSLLCLDDFSEELKNPETIKLLKKIINKHRHYNLSILLSALTMKSIPKSIRSLIDVYVIFKLERHLARAKSRQNSLKVVFPLCGWILLGPRAFLAIWYFLAISPNKSLK